MNGVTQRWQASRSTARRIIRALVAASIIAVVAIGRVRGSAQPRAPIRSSDGRDGAGGDPRPGSRSSTSRPLAAPPTNNRRRIQPES
jgi:hypothetical protein